MSVVRKCDLDKCKRQVDSGEDGEDATATLEQDETCVEKLHDAVSSAFGHMIKHIIREIFKPEEEGGEIETRECIIEAGLFNGQEYHHLKQSCLEEEELFVDPVFPPDDTSISYSGDVPEGVVWMRPKEICEQLGMEPKFFDDTGVTRFDIKQGELGNCWFLAALANLTLSERLFSRVVPIDQTFDDGDYAGIFHFRFWHYGEWVDVVVDDCLPTRDGNLLYTKSEVANEFWSALIEKAYAKLYGSYEALRGGSTTEGMIDFSGGCGEQYDMRDPDCPPNLFKIISKSFARDSMNACSMRPDPLQLEARTNNGLVRGHAYSITQAVTANIPNDDGDVDRVDLLRIRNPWGNAVEWRGPWADESDEWSFISSVERERLGIEFGADGEFWMAFDDFKVNFDMVEICNLAPCDDEEDCGKWTLFTLHDSWDVEDGTAGGCRNYIDTFANNPQFAVTLTDTDEDDDEDLCTLIISLMQKGHRTGRQTGAKMLTIGFVIYVYPDEYLDEESGQPTRPLDTDFFRYHRSVARSPAFVNLREVSKRLLMPPATYVVIPSTFEADVEGDYILRLMAGHGSLVSHGRL